MIVGMGEVKGEGRGGGGGGGGGGGMLIKLIIEWKANPISLLNLHVENFLGAESSR